jgi:hypothetical protein
MKILNWSEEKNTILKNERDMSFEEILIAINEGGLLDILEHPNKKKYPNEKIFVIEVNCYVYLVPFAENNNEIFLKTIIPSRKATKQYLINNQ